MAQWDHSQSQAVLQHSSGGEQGPKAEFKSGSEAPGWWIWGGGSRCSWSGSLKLINPLNALTPAKTPNSFSESLCLSVTPISNIVCFVCARRRCYASFDKQLLFGRPLITSS